MADESLAEREYRKVAYSSYVPDGSKFKIGDYVMIHPDVFDFNYSDLVCQIVGIRWAEGEYIDPFGVVHSGEFEYALDCYPKLFWEHELEDA